MLAVLRDRLPPVKGEEQARPPAATFSLPPQRLADLSAAFPWRGDFLRLDEIANWGAAICKVSFASSDVSEDTANLLTAAASFNLAVALFDSLVDEKSMQLQTVAPGLRPDCLRRVLHHPGTFSLAPVPGSGELIVRLFDDTLRTAGNYWQHNIGHLEFLGSLLEAMYNSELGSSDDPIAAKELPVLFMGAIGTAEPQALDLYVRLGRFIAAWDDWLDQDEDILKRKPNIFFGVARGRRAFAFYSRVLLRIIRGRDSFTPIIRQLTARLDSVLAAAQSSGNPALDRTVDLLKDLLA